MKKLFVCILVIAPILAKAQYGTEVTTFPWNATYIYLGSLPVSNAGNLHKIKVDVLGGGWESNFTGETTYFIANRDRLQIRQITMASNNADRYSLHAYNNSGGGIDFYLLTNNFTAIAVKSVMLGGNATSLISNTTSLSPPAGLSEITPLNIIPVLVTGSEGNIGINTSAPDPAYKLSVNGTVRAKEIKVDAGWSDYVFFDNYTLRPLKEVERFIIKNKHLPDVPSATEVEKKGINVGQADALLLRKIEELTLYLIEKDKEIKKLKAQQERFVGQAAEIKLIKKQLRLVTGHQKNVEM